MDYSGSIKLLTSSDKFYINLGLERISEILKLLGNPQEKLKCIQVAGTNGKGSVCAILDSILRKAGYKTGLYTSPHIFEYTERIKINGCDISRVDFAKYVKEITNLAEDNKIHLTEFEILTAVMFKYFEDNKIDVAILETGLGGRFDATNIIKKNECAIITHIDLDHTERLGDTKEKIAFEKSGIIKPNSTVITGEYYEVIKDRADELNSLFVLAAPNVLSEYLEILPLKGEQQKENLALVLALIKLKYKDISKETIMEGLKEVNHPCRFQYIKEKNLIIDGAHNPNCFEVLKNNLDKYFPKIPKQYIFGCLKTKDYRKMINYITTDRYLKTLYFYKFNNKNACDYAMLSKEYKKGRELKSISEVTFSEDNLTVICGSLYMLNELITE